MTNQSQSPPLNEPLGKSQGTVRAYLAMSLVAAFEVSHVVGAGALIFTAHLPEAMALLGSLAVQTAAIVGYYFGYREGGKAGARTYLMLPPMDDSDEPVNAMGFVTPSEDDLNAGLRTRR